MLLQRVKPLARILAEGSDHEGGLKRSLGPWALTAMGIGAIIGTGIFVLTGVASATRAGPSLTLSFVVAGIVSALAALCYAEVSSKIPISGSAYTYTYATLGELLAWIVGWGLVLEYALGASTVSVGWSGYFNFILHTLFNLNIPQAWQHSHWDATPGIANLPAAGIILLITALLVRGTRESGTVNAVIVAIKIAVVLFFIAIGVGHINPANYHLPPGPQSGEGGYFPFGVAGMLGGAAFIFFAYIGFDAVSTTAEEAKNPAKDLPFGIIASLVICTLLYIIVVAILNGMVPFYKLNVAFPVAFAVDSVGLAWAGVIISFGAIAGLDDRAARDDVRSDARLLRDVARRTDSIALRSASPGLADAVDLADLLRHSHRRRRCALPDQHLGIADQHGDAQRVRFGRYRRADSAQAPPGDARCLPVAVRPVHHPRARGGLGALPDLLPQDRQPGGLGLLPARLARLLDLARRRPALLLLVRPPQEHGRTRRGRRLSDRATAVN